MVRPLNRRRLGVYQSPWHLVATFGFLILPVAFLMFFARYAHLASDVLLLDVMASIWRLVLAYCVSAVLAWLLAVSFYRGRRAVVALPFFDVLQSFPIFAILPMASYVWDPSDATVIFVLVLTMLWPIFFTLTSSLRRIKNDWHEAVTIAGLRGWDYVQHFLWPVSIPGLITGSIIGIGEGWEALIATEIILSTKTGLGEFFQTFATDLPVTALGIFGFLLVIFTMNKLLWLPLLEWSHHETEE